MLAGCAAVSLLIDLGRIHGGHHGDSLVLVLASLVKWTPMYWEQNRLGLLVPLLALPFQHPFVNLLVQGGINIFCWFAMVALTARYVLRDGTWPWAASLTGATFLLLAPEPYRFEYLVSQPLGVSMSLGLGALLAAERAWSRRSLTGAALAFLLACLAHWVNLGAFVFIAPLVLGRALVIEGVGVWRAGGPGLAATVGGAGVGWLLSRFVGVRVTVMGTAPISSWPFAWARLLEDAWSILAPHQWPLGLLASAALGALLLAHPRLRVGAGRPLGALLGLVLAAAAAFLYVGTLKWVRINEYAERYIALSVLFVHLGLAAVAARPLGWVCRGRRRVGSALAALPIALAALLSYGAPSLSEARRALDKHGGLTEDLLASGATHLVGTYWNVWPAVFHSSLVLRERGEARRVYGLTYRSRATEELWRAIPRASTRVAAIRGDSEVERWLGEYRFEGLAPIEERPTLVIYGYPE